LTEPSINSYLDLRVWQDAMVDLQPVLAQCESLGKTLRALIRSLQGKSAK
jgi:hypothetical protein